MDKGVADRLQTLHQDTLLRREGERGRAGFIASLSEDVLENWPTVSFPLSRYANYLLAMNNICNIVPGLFVLLMNNFGFWMNN